MVAQNLQAPPVMATPFFIKKRNKDFRFLSFLMSFSLSCGFVLVPALLPMSQLSARAEDRGVHYLSSSQEITSYLDKIESKGWTPAPVYFWSKPARPLVSTANGAVCMESQEPTEAELPKLPDGDLMKSRILAEYKLLYMSRKALNRGQRSIYIDVYQFEKSDGALAAYFLLRKGATTVVKRGDASSEDEDSISFCSGNVFVSISGTSQDDSESKDVVRALANDIVPRMANPAIPALPSPSILSRLPGLDLLTASEKLIAGPISAERFCFAPYLDTLTRPLSQPFATAADSALVAGAIADYQIRDPYKERLKLMVLEFSSEESARRHYQAYIYRLLETRAKKRADAQSPSAEQASNIVRVGENFLGIEVKGKLVVVVTGAKKRFSPQLLLRQIRAI